MSDHLEERIERLEATMYGSNGKFGVAVMTMILWRTYVWLLCAGSFCAGVIFKQMVERL